MRERSKDDESEGYVVIETSIAKAYFAFGTAEDIEERDAEADIDEDLVSVLDVDLIRNAGERRLTESGGVDTDSVFDVR